MPDTVTVPGTLKGHAATIWRSAFLSAYDGTCKDSGDRRDECAARVAWSAVKGSYRKGAGGEWVAKAGVPPQFQKGNDQQAAPADKAGAPSETPAPDGEDGAKKEQDRFSPEWRDAFAAALLGECVKTDDPVGCAIQTADNAIFGVQEQQGQTEQQQPQEQQPQGQTAASPPQGQMMTQKTEIRLIHRNDYGDLSLPIVIRKDYSPEKRAEFAKKGWALPDGSYPIADREDLMDAAHSFGRAPESKRASVKAHIRKRARQLGMLDQMSAEWGGKEEKSMNARVRDQEEDFDQELLDAGMANRVVARPPYINSNDWMARPLQQRTVGALIRERAIARSYENAVERAMEGGWQSFRNPTRKDEFIFQRWIDSLDGMLLQRAVLVRRSGTNDWQMRELTRGASLSLAVQIPADERRFGDPRF